MNKYKIQNSKFRIKKSKNQKIKKSKNQKITENETNIKINNIN
jgi:hypothetical protein